MAKGNALAVLDQAPQLPSDLVNFFDDESNIEAKQTVPTLSYEGKVWTIGLDGEKTKLMRTNSDGDKEAVPVFKGVILDYAKKRGRAYYEGAYDPAKVSMPKCWSEDGITPDEAVKEKCASKCAECPFAVKGSKVTEQGKAVVACSEHRMVVVVPAANLTFQPLRMKLAITSDWDGQSKDHEEAGWFAFKNYTDMLRARQVKHTAQLVTKFKFDPNVAYPKVLFSPDRYLNQTELETVKDVVKSAAVTDLLSGGWTPNGIDGTKKVTAPPEEAKTPAPVDNSAELAAAAAAEAAAKKAAEKAAKVKAAQEAAEAAAAAAAAAAKAAAEDDEGDDGMGELMAAKPEAAKPAAVATAPKTEKPKEAKKAADKPKETKAADNDDTGLGDLLAEWA